MQYFHIMRIYIILPYRQALVLTAIKVDAPNEANVNAEPPMGAGALQAHEGAHGKGTGRTAGGRNDEGGPPRLSLGTVGADLILRLGHQRLEALLELLLRRHFVALSLPS